MSDTFDHEGDAWDSLLYDNDPGGYNGFDYDPNFNHHGMRYVSIEAETEKAYLFELSIGRCWIPKKLCRDLKRNRKTFKLWDGFTLNPLKEENIVDMFDEVEEIEDSPKIVETKKKIKKVKEKIKDFIYRKDDLNWLLDPDFKFKKVKVYKNY